MQQLEDVLLQPTEAENEALRAEVQQLRRSLSTSNSELAAKAAANDALRAEVERLSDKMAEHAHIIQSMRNFLRQIGRHEANMHPRQWLPQTQHAPAQAEQIWHQGS